MNPLSAANAYASLARLTDPSRNLGKAADPAGQEGPSFGQMVKEALSSVADAGRKSDAQSQALAAGKANIVDVVTAVSETQVAMETLVSVRDRVISAYEEIMRMPI